MVDVKDFRARVKSTGDEGDELGDGQFEALVSVFGNEDSAGDVVTPGAFAKSLAAWEERGDPIPVIWSHEWSDPYAHIGHVLTAEETDDGLQVRAQLDLDNPKAEQVYRLLKGRRVTQFSFAFDVRDAAEGTRGEKSVTELRELALHEVGPCLLGANQATELIAAKARQLSRGPGRACSNTETLRAAYDALGAVLAETETTEDARDADAQDDASVEADSASEEEAGQSEAEAAADDTRETGKSAAQSPRPAPAQVLASLTIDKMKGAGCAYSA